MSNAKKKIRVVYLKAQYPRWHGTREIIRFYKITSESKIFFIDLSRKKFGELKQLTFFKNLTPSNKVTWDRHYKLMIKSGK